LLFIGLSLVAISIVMLRTLAPKEGRRPKFLDKPAAEFAAILLVQVPLLSGLGIVLGAMLKWMAA
jgi:hypothetical protein